ncbi:hypothetical protein BC828DRAFT_18357 [Blastocladiella britannica]|nr:hypothetical protein BC828DRAFT_18357 [Blastocladiella britannica]
MFKMTSSMPGKQCPELKAVATALKMPIDIALPDCCKWAEVLCNNGGNVTKIVWSVKGLLELSLTPSKIWRAWNT